MLVLLTHRSGPEYARVLDLLAGRQVRHRVIEHDGRVALLTEDAPGLRDLLLPLPAVSAVQEATSWVLASLAWHPEPTTILLGAGVAVGRRAPPAIIAGPCAVESESQILAVAHGVAAAGAKLLRGGAFKPRTSPYAFQGLGATALPLLARAREETGLRIVTEALDEAGVDQVAEVADVIQIGSRNMGNYPLLRRAGRSGRPILLKRGMAATVEELLLAAEYVLGEGNPNVILCERGIRGFDRMTRNVLDLAAIPVLQAATHLPVIVDPSHATGRSDLVPAMARAALAAGADGLMLEVHPEPGQALSDGAQSLSLAAFVDVMSELNALTAVLDR